MFFRATFPRPQIFISSSSNFQISNNKFYLTFRSFSGKIDTESEKSTAKSNFHQIFRTTGRLIGPIQIFSHSAILTFLLQAFKTVFFVPQRSFFNIPSKESLELDVFQNRFRSFSSLDIFTTSFQINFPFFSVIFGHFR